MNILSVDIGGSYIKYAVMNEKSEFASKDQISIPQEGRVELISTLAGLYERFPCSVPQAQVVPCRHGSDANLIGALHCCLSAFC